MPPLQSPRRCRVVDQTDLGAPFVLTCLEGPEIAATVQPGQFVMVRIPGSHDPLLGRPFSIFSVLPAAPGQPARFTLVYHVVGRGTERMAKTAPGGELLVLGPLGHGFELQRLPTRALLVAGGIGIAGLFLLATALRAAAVETRLLYGARGRHDLVTADRFRDLGIDVRTATDDGSDGHKGFVTDLLADELARSGAEASAVYACGPSPMMRRVREMTMTAGVACELALEAHMACGFGVCIGCAIPSATVPGTYRLVCTDGPCLPAAEVLP